MNRILFVALLLFSVHVFGQDVTLQQCYSSINNKHPKAGEKVIFDKVLQSKVNILKKNLLPQLDMDVKASYQSEVVSLPFTIPNQNIPELDKDQYKATINVSQVIYDGGLTKLSIEKEKAYAEIEQQRVEVSLYNVKIMASQFFFSALLLQQQKEVLNNILKKIETKKQQLKAAVEEGAVLSAELNILYVEIIKLKQQIKQLENNRQASIDVLSQLTGEEYSGKTNFVLPQSNIQEGSGFVNRPEIILLNSRYNHLLSLKKISESKNNPKVFAFASAGYGKPGINMLSNSFNDFYLAGIGLTWKLWDWHQAKEEVKVLDLNADIIQKEKENLHKNFDIKLIQINTEIKNLEQLIADDDKIITLQKEIVEVYSAKLNNGTITMSEYIDRVNEEKQAELNFKLHTLKLVKAKTDYNMNL